MKRMLIAALSILALGPAAAAQEDEDWTFASSDVELHYYEPQDVRVQDLLGAAQRVYGRTIQVTGVGSPHPVENIFQLGSKIVVYDTPAYATRVLEGLRKLEGPSGTEAQSKSAYQTLQFLPSNVSLTTALDALSSFHRHLGPGQNIQPLRERSILVIRDTPDRLAEMQALLARIDVPQAQAMLTCYLLYPADEEDARRSPAPADLVTNLDALTHVASWQVVGQALVRTTAVADAPIELRIDADGLRYELALHPIAFDASTGSVTLGRCTFTRFVTTTQTIQSATGETVGTNTSGPTAERIFATSTAIRGGEWTVLGAAGNSPYVALRIAPIPD